MARHALADVDAGKSNTNIDNHDVVLDAMTAPVHRALDVGCGEGILTRQPAMIADEVVGIDPDQPSIDLARQQTTAPDVTFVCDDFMTADLAPNSFDLVAAIVAIHHMDERAALARMKEITAPGGTIAIVGVARISTPIDFVRTGFYSLQNRSRKRRSGYYEHSAPMVWPPPHTYRQLSAIVAEELPGAVFDKSLRIRYSIVWTKPT